MALTLYYAPRSRSIRALWLLEELGVPYDRKALDLSRGEHRRPDYLGVNPSGKVPALVDEGVVLFESAAICTHLADRFADRGLAPAIGDPRRGPYLSWMFYAVGQVEPALTDHFRQQKGSPQFAWEELARVYTVLTGALTPGPYLLEDQFSAADVFLGSQLLWAASMGLLEEAQTTLHAYCARLAQRPAYLRAFKLHAGE